MERREEHLPDELLATAAGMIPIPVVGPLAGLFTKHLVRKMREERYQRISTALKAAERLSGMDREELGEVVAEDPRLIPLLERILFTAGMTGHDRTLSAMGAALAHALRNRDRIDEAELLLIAVSDLRGEHIALLQALAADPEAPKDDISEPRSLRSVSWVAEKSRLNARVCGLCLAALSSRGLVAAVTGIGGTTVYQATDLGRILLDVLDELD